jgi:hypothetical protein
VIVFNTVNSRSAALPRDPTRLRPDDVQFMPAGADQIVPRFTQDSVIDKGPKTRAQVLGEPVSIDGQQVRDFGYQLRQLDALAHDGNYVLVKGMRTFDAVENPGYVLVRAP